MASKHEKERRAELLRGSVWDRADSKRQTPLHFDADVARDQIESVGERCSFGNGVADETILRAETRLGVRLPPSYRWWLKTYGSGQIGGYELVGLWDEFEEEELRQPDAAFPGVLAYSVELDRKNGRRPHHEIELLSFEGDEVYVLDLSHVTDDENPIFLEDASGTREVYANDFYEFLWKVLR